MDEKPGKNIRIASDFECLFDPCALRKGNHHPPWSKKLKMIGLAIKIYVKKDIYTNNLHSHKFLAPS